MSRLAITLGDPAGIGPEIVLRACAQLRDRPDIRMTVVAPRICLDEAARYIGGEIGAAWRQGPSALGITMEEIAPPAAPVPTGIVSAQAGAVAYASIERAAQLAMSGEADAIVTPPINKEAVNLAGYAYSGHTDMLMHLTGGAEPVMMLLHGAMRVTHVSTHVPLSRVAEYVTPRRLRRVIDLTRQALQELGIARPRIAVAALNPHAGEGGILGREDIDVTAPLVRAMASEGYDVEGPEAGDTVFVKLQAGRFDAVVAMYHDQGHIPVKLLGFRVDPATGAWNLNGINITLGLPVLRTSVDHGTAFDIAGRKPASEQSLIEAMEHAHAMVNSRRGR